MLRILTKNKKNGYPKVAQEREIKTKGDKNNKNFGGDKRGRTADLLHAMQALYQLSYTPKTWAAL